MNCVSIRTWTFKALIGLIAFANVLSFAQPDPRQVLAGAILQLQTGMPNPSWYGAQLWQTIAMQTGNSGLYPQLAALGPVTNIVINQVQQLPGGSLYAMTASHQKGASTWYLGIAGNRIEYANFNIGGFPVTSNPDPLPTPPSGKPKEVPGAQSDSCKKFPNLCP